MGHRELLRIATGLVGVALLLTAALAQGHGEPGSPQELAVSWDDPQTGSGVVRPLTLTAPWDFSAPPLRTGRDAVLRSADGQVYAVSRADGTITVIDAERWVITDILSIGPSSGLQDIAVVGRGLAYVTRSTSAWLLRLDLETGSLTEVLDLSFLADKDGIPDMGMMAVRAGRLFIQIRRIDGQGHFSPPAYLAVMDVATEQLVDSDPQAPGVQAIELRGTFPKMKMQRARRNDRLYVGATGHAFDAGGIEEIDAVRLRSLGLVVAEADGFVGADLGPFVFAGPDRGFLVYTTDFALSSHFHPFWLTGEVGEPSPIYNRVGYLAPVLAFHRPSDVVFFPDGPAPNAGVMVLDGTTGLPLRKTPVPTQSVPNDFVFVLPSGRFQ